MIKNLIHWAVYNRLIVILLATALLIFGVYSFQRVNVEAYPDPAPAIIEVVARFPGASSEEVERQVTIPLEVALAGMPGLTYTRTQSMFELCHIRNQFDYGVELSQARQEVINRLGQAQLPASVTPEISPESPTGEIFRYVLTNPIDKKTGREIYNLNDMKSLQDYTLERQFRRLTRVADVTSFGGTVKRYEIHPDPARMQRYGISLQQIKDAVASSNSNAGGEYIVQGSAAYVVRSLGLIGGGRDPIETAMGTQDPMAAFNYLRAEEQRRVREIRDIVLSATNNVPVRVDDVVEGGPLPHDDPEKGDSPRAEKGIVPFSPAQGVVVGYQTRLGRVARMYPLKDSRGQEILDVHEQRQWHDDEDVVECVVLMRYGEQSLPALAQIHALVDQLNNNPGRLLPGVKILPYYDRTDLIHLTTDTVRENLLTGMALVAVVLLMFLSNVRSAIVVAVNIPLALLFAFAVLFLRGKSANLLSIGAVDFGIIVDSSVIMVENIYRHLSRGINAELPIRQRIILASNEMQRSLTFSTAIMVCAFLPLFTMAGPEGRIFGPMADTYAFALGGALLLAVTLSPVLCEILLPRMKPRPDNFFVRCLRAAYAKQLDRCLRNRWLVLSLMAVVMASSLALLPFLGREFMPELEEGNIWIQAQFPLNSSLEEVRKLSRTAVEMMKRYPETEWIGLEVGRPDDGTDPAGFYNSEFYLPLKPRSEWPIPPGRSRPRTKLELTEEIDRDLHKNLFAVEWNFSQNIRNMVMESLSGIRGENSVKIIGPDLNELESAADRVVAAMRRVRGIEDVGVYRIMGQSDLTLPVNRRKCSRWNLNVGDVQAVVDTAVGGKAFSQMIEGERSFDIMLRFPQLQRSTLDAILKIPVEVSKNTVVPNDSPGLAPTAVTGPSSGPSAHGTTANLPSITGSGFNATFNDLTRLPRRPLGDLVTPQGPDGRPNPGGSFIERGASDIYRDQGERLIAIKFDVRNRDLASAVDDAKRQIKHLIRPPCRLEWSGEFLEMEQAEGRLLIVIPLAFGMVMVLLYLAFGSLTDVLLVLSNVMTMTCGGIWALWLTHTPFSVSAAVGFISIFGVAVMDSLIRVSSCNRRRLDGQPMHEAVMGGSLDRMRPLMMTVLTAIFGLMPAAFSTRIGAQTQRPLAIVVIGGMTCSLLLSWYLTPVLYSVIRRAMPVEDAARLGE
jgi:cobalt-zinc-cadmium resistance protein CzcA